MTATAASSQLKRKKLREATREIHEESTSNEPQGRLEIDEIYDILNGIKTYDESDFQSARKKGKGNGMCFGKLSLNKVNRVEAPQCLPEDKRKRHGDDGLGYGDDEETAYQDTHGSKRLGGRMREEPFEVVIPLGNGRMKTPEIRKALKAEYAARYLEMLGASPTPQNLQLIWKYMPLEKCKIQQVFHPGLSKSEKKNYISIRPMYNVHKAIQGRVHPSEVEDLNPLPISRLAERATTASKDHSTSIHEGKPHESHHHQGHSSSSGGKQHIGSSFEGYKERYVFPYNLPAKYTYEPSNKNRNKQQDEAAQQFQERRLALLTKRGRLNVTSDFNSKLNTDEDEGQQDDDNDGNSDDNGQGGEASSSSTAPLSEADGSKKNHIANKPEITAEEEHIAHLHQMLIDKLVSSSAARQELHLTQHPPPSKTGTATTTTTATDTSRATTTIRAHEEQDDDDDDDTENHADQLGTNINEGIHLTTNDFIGGGGSIGILGGASADFGSSGGNGVREKETDNPPNLTQHEIQDILANFIDTFPFKKYWGSPTAAVNTKSKLKDRITEIKAGIKSEKFAEFVGGVAEFMYWSFIAPRKANENTTFDQDERFLVLYEEILSMLERKKARQYHGLVLPILLLTLRVGTDSVLQHSFPTWAKLPETQQLLKEIDTLLTTLLDPMNYLSHLAPVESSPQALRILHKKRMPTRMPLTFTSPMVRFLVGNPESKEAKTLLSTKHPQINTQMNKPTMQLISLLSPTVRSKILDLITSKKLGQPLVPSRTPDPLAMAKKPMSKYHMLDSTPMSDPAKPRYNIAISQGDHSPL